MTPCSDSEADVAAEMECDEGLAAAVHSEFTAALQASSVVLGARNAVLTSVWVVVPRQKPRGGRSHARGRSGKVAVRMFVLRVA